MFNLMPWKKRDGGGVSVQHAEPSRQDFGLQPFARFREEMDDLWNQFFGSAGIAPRGTGSPGRWEIPRFDWNLGWEDKGNEYVFHAELPGFEPGDFDVKLSGNTLIVRAEHKAQQEDREKGSSYRYRSHSRTVTLPQGADQDKVDARYHSGVLEIHLAKSEQARGKRIPVMTN